MTLDEAIDIESETAHEKLTDYMLRRTNDKAYNTAEVNDLEREGEYHKQLAEWLWQLKQIKDIVQEYHDNYIEWGTGQSSVAFHKIVKIIDGGDTE